MKKVMYKGRSSARVFNSEDLQKSGVEAGVFTEMTFPRNTPVEVEDVVADALIENPRLYDNFAIFEEIEEHLTLDIDIEEPPSAKAGSKSRTKL